MRNRRRLDCSQSQCIRSPSMKLHRALLVCAAALFAAAGASAQLKPPREGKAAAPARSAPAPAPAPAAAPAAAPAPADSANAEKEEAGKLAAGGWLVLLDRRDWGRAWETSSAVFRGAVPL